MSLETLLDHHCDIYHIKCDEGVSPGYKLPASTEFTYSDVPDLQGIPCHFSVKMGSVVVVQAEPNRNYEAKIKLTVPKDIDIRVNDKIVDCSNGYEYTAEVPRNIHGHHIVVMLNRSEIQRAL